MKSNVQTYFINCLFKYVHYQYQRKQRPNLNSWYMYKSSVASKPTETSTALFYSEVVKVFLLYIGERMTQQEGKKLTAKQRMETKYLDKRNQIWQLITPVKEELRILWEQKRKKGFVNIPRVMPLILKIMDYLSKKEGGKPVSNTYFALWCRDFGTAFVEIKDSDELASEAGFSGNRAVTTLNSRLKILNKETDSSIGFIRTQKTSTGKYKAVLMLNPLLVIYLHYKEGRLPKPMYDEIFVRSTDVGDRNLKTIQELGDEYQSIVTNFLNELTDEKS